MTNPLQYYLAITMAAVLGLVCPGLSIAGDVSIKWGAFLAGGVSTLAIHELGHIAVAEYHDVDYRYDGWTIVYPDADFSDSEHLQIASAGFQAQWLASEIAFRKLGKNKFSSANSKEFTRGMVAGHAAISFAYLTFLKDHEDGDIEGMSQATGLSNNELALLVAIPAALDTWRLSSPDVPDWVPKLSVAAKGLGFAAIWTY